MPALTSVLRVLVGLVLVASAVLKLRSIDHAAFHMSAVWQVLGESRLAVVAASLLEGVGGLFLVFGLRVRIAAMASGLMLLTGGIAIAVHEAARAASFPTCGCLGSPQVESYLSGLPWQIRLAVLLLSLVVIFIADGGGRGARESPVTTWWT